MKANEKIIKAVKELIKADEDTFVNCDIGSWSGSLFIHAHNQMYPNILGKIVEIDSLLTDVLDADVLDTNIHVSFEDGPNGEARIRVTIKFEYE